jgi:hypothetical protein
MAETNGLEYQRRRADALLDDRLGRIERGVDGLRLDLAGYVRAHAVQHRDEDRDRGASGRWIVTTTVAMAGLGVALVVAAIR